MTEDEIEDLARQIICLRNRYVHSGYYIKNHSLRITFNDLDGKTSKLKNSLASIICPVLLIGNHSVIPSIIRKIIVFMMLNNISSRS